MKLLSMPYITQETTCPYLEGNLQQLSVFWASEITSEELEELLSTGWRKFGEMNFKPSCKSCQKCTPLRVNVEEFKLSKSQRRVINKNSQVTTKLIKNPKFRNEYFELYSKHSKVKFNKETIETEKEFENSFFINSETLLISEFRIDNKLIAFGVLEKSTIGLSSVYFVYDTDYAHLSLGTFGALKEIEYAKQENLRFYYLGYWIKENRSLNYKDSFRPSQKFDWQAKTWK